MNNIEWNVSELMNLKLLTNNWPVDKDILTSFIDILISNAKTRTGVSEKDIKEHNKEFYNYLDTYFKENKYLSISDNSEEFKTLCLTFKLPTININQRSVETILPGDITKQNPRETSSILDKPRETFSMINEEFGFLPEKQIYTHTDCIKLFNNLSSEEKLKFILEFQNIEIKLSPSVMLK